MDVPKEVGAAEDIRRENIELGRRCIQLKGASEAERGEEDQHTRLNGDTVR